MVLFRHILRNGIVVTQTQVEYAEQLGALQRLVFPTLAEEELLRPEHYRFHVLELFPEGQLMALDGETVVGMSSTIRRHLDNLHDHPTFAQLSQGGWMTGHQPDGVWLYGMDVGVHPGYRRMGIARALYAARQLLVRKLGLCGQVAAGMLTGYSALKDRLTPHAYYQKVISGELADPTVTPQFRIGFEPHGLVAGYVTDPICDGYCALITLRAEKEVPFE